MFSPKDSQHSRSLAWLSIVLVACPLLYLLSVGPALAVAFWLRETTGWDGFYATMYFYYPLLLFGPDSLISAYVEWWVVDVFGTVWGLVRRTELRCRLRTLLLFVALCCGLCHLYVRGALTGGFSQEIYHQRHAEWTYQSKIVDGVVVYQPITTLVDRVSWSKLISDICLVAAVVFGTLWIFLWDWWSARDSDPISPADAGAGTTAEEPE